MIFAIVNLSHKAPATRSSPIVSLSQFNRYFAYQSKMNNLVLCPEAAVRGGASFPSNSKFLMMGDCYPEVFNSIIKPPRWMSLILNPSRTYFCNAPLGLGVNVNLMPTIYDICLMDSLEDSQKAFRSPWERKSPIAYWRGGTTGTNFVETNIRVAIYEKIKGDENYDFRFTAFKNPKTSVWGEWSEGVKLAKRVSPRSIYEHKYVISADGNAAPWGFINDMLSNSLILKVESEFITWYSDVFRPFEDYLPVSRDLSNLEEMRRYAIENDKTCKDMAENSSVKAYDLIKSIPRVLNEIQGNE